MLGCSHCPHANTDVSPTPTPQTSLPSQLPALEGPHHSPWLSQPGDLQGLEGTQVTVLNMPPHAIHLPRVTRDARTPWECPAVRAIGQASPGGVHGSCCQLLCEYRLPLPPRDMWSRRAGMSTSSHSPTWDDTEVPPSITGDLRGHQETLQSVSLGQCSWSSCCPASDSPSSPTPEGCHPCPPRS